MISQDVEKDLYATLEMATLSGLVQVLDGNVLADYLDDVGKCDSATALRWMMDNSKVPGSYDARLVSSDLWTRDWNWLYGDEKCLNSPDNQKRKNEFLPKGLWDLLPPSTSGTEQPCHGEAWEVGDAEWKSYCSFREACEALYSAFTLWEGEK